ncbi:MAG TPA: ABC transporter ATP-binding protein [Acidimicrobiales bacterium]
MLRSLGRLLRTYLRPYRRELLLVLLFQTVQATLSLTLPSINADIIDNGVIPGDTGYIWSRGALMLGLTGLQVVFAVAAVYFGSRAAMGFGRDVRKALFGTVTGYSSREVARFGASSLITRITNDVAQVQILVQMTCTLLVAAPITMVGGIIMALREDVGLSVVLVVSVPVLMATAGLVLSRMVPGFQRMQVRIDGVNGVLREQITGIRVVRAFVREPDEARRFAAGNELLTESGLFTGRLMALMPASAMFVVNVSSVAAVWIAADRIAAGDMQIGAMVAFLTYLMQILMAVMMASFMAALAPRAAVCADRIEEVLDTPTTVAQPEEPVFELPGHGLLELRDVSFRYPGAEHPVLSGVSFTVSAGQTTAIIGSTGAGKTTVVNLIPRLFDVTSGAVLVDGVDVRQLDLNTLWEHVAIVPQRAYLFSGTVASNLRHANPDATDEQLWDALEIAQASDFVASMPGGLDAPIEQGGTNVSGGQRQRLAIARALVRRPDVYVFDDAFSALDVATDARLRTALAPHTRDAAVIVVAQRVSSIRDADQIVVLEDGEVMGVGTHRELLDTCPTYVEIVESQMASEDAA